MMTSQADSHHSSERWTDGLQRPLYVGQSGGGHGKSNYLIYSSVFGKVLTEITTSGAKDKTYVHDMSGGVIASQQVVFTPPSTYSSQVRWEHTDPSGVSYMQTFYNGTFISTANAELDPTDRAVQMMQGGDSEENLLLLGHGTFGNQWFCVDGSDEATPENCTIRISACPSGQQPDGRGGCEPIIRDLPIEMIALMLHGPTACDKHIAELFGGTGAVVTTTLEPVTKQKEVGVKKSGRPILENILTDEYMDRSYHLKDNGAFHIFPDLLGTDSLEVGLYVPQGASVLPGKLIGERKQEDGGITNTFAFHFVSGEYKGVEVWFDHVGGTYGGTEGGDNLGKEFIRRNRNGSYSLIGPKNAALSSQIGVIGGPGGRTPDPSDYKNPIYRHTHVTVKKNGRRIDPRAVFCSGIKY